MKEDTRYAAAVGRMRSLQKRFLERGLVRQMVEAESAAAAFALLQETSYAEHAVGLDVADFEAVFVAAISEAYATVRSMMVETAAVDLLARRYDMFNLKVAVKGERSGLDCVSLLSPLGTLEPDRLRAAWLDRDWKHMPGWLAGVMRRTELMIEHSGDPYLIDLMLDRQWLEQMRRWSAGNSDYLQQWLMVRIDQLNSTGLLRAVKNGWSRERWRGTFVAGGDIPRRRLEVLFELSPEQILAFLADSSYRRQFEAVAESYRDSQSLSCVEDAFDGRLVEALGRERFVVFGPEPLLSYILYRETEIRLLRTVFIGRINGLGADLIHERIQGLYAAPAA